MNVSSIFFSNSNSFHSSADTSAIKMKKRNEINCELVRLLLSSLNATTGQSIINEMNVASFMVTTNQETYPNQPNTQTPLISKLMSGLEVMYIKNAFGLLDIVKHNDHKLRNGNSDYKTLCSAVIQLLAMLLGVSPEIGSGVFDATSFNKGTTVTSNTENLEPSNHSHVLNILIGLIAKGELETIKKISSQSSNKKQEADNYHENYDMEVDEDGVLIDEEYDLQQPSHIGTNQDDTAYIRPAKSSKSNNNNRKTKSSQQQRQDMQTISKLDHLYQSKVSQTLGMYLSLCPGVGQGEST